MTIKRLDHVSVVVGPCSRYRFFTALGMTRRQRRVCDVSRIRVKRAQAKHGGHR